MVDELPLSADSAPSEKSNITEEGVGESAPDDFQNELLSHSGIESCDTSANSIFCPKELDLGRQGGAAIAEAQVHDSLPTEADFDGFLDTNVPEFIQGLVV